MPTAPSVSPTNSPSSSVARSPSTTTASFKPSSKTWIFPVPSSAEALGRTTDDYSLASLRYDLSKLRAKGFVERLDKSRRYRLTPAGYRICVVYLKLFEKLYAPLTSGILKPFKPDRLVADDKATRLDKLYCTVVRALDELAAEVGLKVAWLLSQPLPKSHLSNRPHPTCASRPQCVPLRADFAASFRVAMRTRC